LIFVVLVLEPRDPLIKILMHIETNGIMGARISRNIWNTSILNRRAVFIFKWCSIDIVLINIQLIGLRLSAKKTFIEKIEYHVYDSEHSKQETNTTSSKPKANRL